MPGRYAVYLSELPPGMIEKILPLLHDPEPILRCAAWLGDERLCRIVMMWGMHGINRSSHHHIMLRTAADEREKRLRAHKGGAFVDCWDVIFGIEKLVKEVPKDGHVEVAEFALEYNPDWFWSSVKGSCWLSRESMFNTRLLWLGSSEDCVTSTPS